MTRTIDSKDIEVKDGTCDRMTVDLVWDKHEGLLVREIAWFGTKDITRVLGRFGLEFDPERTRQAGKAFKRCIAYRQKKYGGN